MSLSIGSAFRFLQLVYVYTNHIIRIYISPLNITLKNSHQKKGVEKAIIEFDLTLQSASKVGNFCVANNSPALNRAIQEWTPIDTPKCAIGSINSHYFHIYNRGWSSTQVRRGLYIPNIRIPNAGGMTIPNIATFDHGTNSDQLDIITGGLPSRELTYPLAKALLKMIFLFPRWDMLGSRTVCTLKDPPKKKRGDYYWCFLHLYIKNKKSVDYYCWWILSQLSKLHFTKKNSQKKWHQPSNSQPSTGFFRILLGHSTQHQDMSLVDTPPFPPFPWQIHGTIVYFPNIYIYHLPWDW